jgi:hypothetical protein
MNLNQTSEEIGSLLRRSSLYKHKIWKVMLLLNRLYANVYRTRWDEDIQLAWYLFDAQLNYTQIDFTRDRAYDISKGTHPYFRHDVGYNVVRIHELKTNKSYLTVANCFNINGVNKTRIDELESSAWKF